MYEFEYDIDGYLVKYKEFSGESIHTYFFITGNTLIRYEGFGEYKSIIKYKSPVKFLHRFEANESWLTPIKREKEELIEEEIESTTELKYPEYYSSTPTNVNDINYIVNLSYPTINCQVHLENNELSVENKFNLNSNMIFNWKRLV